MQADQYDAFRMSLGEQRNSGKIGDDTLQYSNSTTKRLGKLALQSRENMLQSSGGIFSLQNSQVKNLFNIRGSASGQTDEAVAEIEGQSRTSRDSEKEDVPKELNYYEENIEILPGSLLGDERIKMAQAGFSSSRNNKKVSSTFEERNEEQDDEGEEDMDGEHFQNLLLTHEYFKKQLIHTRIDELMKKLNQTFMPIIESNLVNYLESTKVSKGPRVDREFEKSAFFLLNIVDLWDKKQFEKVLETITSFLIADNNYFIILYPLITQICRTVLRSLLDETRKRSTSACWPEEFCNRSPAPEAKFRSRIDNMVHLRVHSQFRSSTDKRLVSFV